MVTGNVPPAGLYGPGGIQNPYANTFGPDSTQIEQLAQAMEAEEILGLTQANPFSGDSFDSGMMPGMQPGGFPQFPTMQPNAAYQQLEAMLANSYGQGGGAPWQNTPGNMNSLISQMGQMNPMAMQMLMEEMQQQQGGGGIPGADGGGIQNQGLAQLLQQFEQGGGNLGPGGIQDPSSATTNQDGLQGIENQAQEEQIQYAEQQMQQNITEFYNTMSTISSKAYQAQQQLIQNI